LGVPLLEPDKVPVPPGTGDPLLGSASPGALAADAPGIDPVIDEDDPLSRSEPEFRPLLPVPIAAAPGAAVSTRFVVPVVDPAVVPAPDLESAPKGTSFWVPGVDPTGGGLLPPIRSHAASDMAAAVANAQNSGLLRRGKKAVVGTMVNSWLGMTTRPRFHASFRNVPLG
jgi:hypothetical protein